MTPPASPFGAILLLIWLALNALGVLSLLVAVVAASGVLGKAYPMGAVFGVSIAVLLAEVVCELERLADEA